jgi:hypothetical protein
MVGTQEPSLPIPIKNFLGNVHKGINGALQETTGLKAKDAQVARNSVLILESLDGFISFFMMAGISSKLESAMTYRVDLKNIRRKVGM